MSISLIEGSNLEQISDIIADSAISSSLDLGYAIIHVGQHPVFGDVTIVTGVGERHAIVRHTA